MRKLHGECTSPRTQPRFWSPRRDQGGVGKASFWAGQAYNYLMGDVFHIKDGANLALLKQVSRWRMLRERKTETSREAVVLLKASLRKGISLPEVFMHKHIQPNCAPSQLGPIFISPANETLEGPWIFLFTQLFQRQVNTQRLYQAQCPHHHARYVSTSTRAFSNRPREHAALLMNCATPRRHVLPAALSLELLSMAFQRFS